MGSIWIAALITGVFTVGGTLGAVVLTQRNARQAQDAQNVHDVQVRQREWEHERTMRRIEDRKKAYTDFLECVEEMAVFRVPRAESVSEPSSGELDRLLDRLRPLVMHVRVYGSLRAWQAARDAVKALQESVKRDSFNAPALKAVKVARNTFVTIVREELDVETDATEPEREAARLPVSSLKRENE